MHTVDLGLGLEGTHILVTGAAGFIGSAVASAFLSAGTFVTCVDIDSAKLAQLDARLSAQATTQSLPTAGHRCITADITDEAALEAAFAGYGTPVAVCIALAALDLSVLPHHASLADMPVAQFQHTLAVNATGTFLTARTWLRQLPPSTPQNASLVLIGSESGTWGERGNADYAASKSAVQGGLLASLRADVPRARPGARVNAVAPGPVDTPRFREECAADPGQFWRDAQGTVALATPVPVAAVARAVVFLASERWSGSVHGQVLAVDGGKMGKIVWEREEVSS